MTDEELQITKKEADDNFKAITLSFLPFLALGLTKNFLRSLETYEYVKEFFGGSEFVTIVRNHGADIATTSGVTLLALGLFYAEIAKKLPDPNSQQLSEKILYKFIGNEEKLVKTVALFGMCFSLYMMIEETFRIYHIDNVSYKAYANTLRGDWGDVIAYSIPLLSGILYFSKKIISEIKT